MRIRIRSGVECPLLRKGNQVFPDEDVPMVTFEKCQKCRHNSGHLLGLEMSLCNAWIEEEEKENKAIIANTMRKSIEEIGKEKP